MLSHARDTDGLVLDVGAHGGRQTLTALKYGRRVLAIDCLHEAYAENLQRLSMHRNLTLVKLCAGASVRLAKLHLAQDSSSLSESMIWATMGKVNSHRKDAGRRAESVLVVPLDAFVTEPVAGVKIDVQGAEGEVFEGMRRILSDHRPAIMFEEQTGGSTALESKYLRPLGYRCDVYHLPIGTDKVCFIPGRHASV